MVRIGGTGSNQNNVKSTSVTVSSNTIPTEGIIYEELANAPIRSLSPINLRQGNYIYTGVGAYGYGYRRYVKINILMNSNEAMPNFTLYSSDIGGDTTADTDAGPAMLVNGVMSRFVQRADSWYLYGGTTYSLVASYGLDTVPYTY